MEVLGAEPLALPQALPTVGQAVHTAGGRAAHLAHPTVAQQAQPGAAPHPLLPEVAPIPHLVRTEAAVAPQLVLTEVTVHPLLVLTGVVLQQDHTEAEVVPQQVPITAAVQDHTEATVGPRHHTEVAVLVLQARIEVGHDHLQLLTEVAQPAQQEVDQGLPVADLLVLLARTSPVDPGVVLVPLEAGLAPEVGLEVGLKAGPGLAVLQAGQVALQLAVPRPHQKDLAVTLMPMVLIVGRRKRRRPLAVMMKITKVMDTACFVLLCFQS